MDERSLVFESLSIAISIILGSLAIAWSLHGVKKRLWLSAFLDFTGRYNEIFKALPTSLRGARSEASLDSLSKEDMPLVIDCVRSYLNLASEEYYLYREGYLDRQTWLIWWSMVTDFLKTRYASEAWLKVKNEYQTFREFSMLVDAAVEGGEDSREM